MDIRWKQRFQNFKQAFLLLQEILESTHDILALEPIVKEGIIQRFEYTYELAWKTLKDKMVKDGLTLEKIAPKYVFKSAFHSKYIPSIEAWLQMSDDRNLMSRTYDHAKFDEVLLRLKNQYYPVLQELFNSAI